MDSDTFSKTALYAGRTDLPPMVTQAVALANRLGFISSCTPEQGELLRVLARGRAGGVIGETGTGCGVGLAWIASAVGPETRLVSVEIDAARAAACQALFAALPNVQVLHGDWRMIAGYGPFDLLVLDGGGGGKRADEVPADPAGRWYSMIFFRRWNTGPRKRRPGAQTAAPSRRRAPTGCSTLISSRPRFACTRGCRPSSPREKPPERDSIADHAGTRPIPSVPSASRARGDVMLEWQRRRAGDE